MWKKILLLVIGVLVLVAAIIVFYEIQTSKGLESGSLKEWRKASLEERTNTVKIITSTEENVELMVACIDKMAEMQDSDKMAVKDAASLCYTGIKLKNNL